MGRKINLYKIMAEQNRKKEKYFANYLKYAKIIAKRAKKLLKNIRVLIFGSIVRGDYNISSDIDILIISNNIPDSILDESRLKLEILKNFEPHIFEIHFATPEMYENWYKNFIKNDYIEID